MRFCFWYRHSNAALSTHYVMRRYRRAPPHRMACLGLLYIQASASTSLTSLRSATSASLRASVSVSRRFSSLSTVSSATDQACSFARRKRGTRVDAVNRPSGYRRTRPRRLSVENPADGSFGSSVLASSRASARRGSFQRDRTSEGERSVASDLNDGRRDAPPRRRRQRRSCAGRRFSSPADPRR